MLTEEQKINRKIEKAKKQVSKIEETLVKAKHKLFDFEVEKYKLECKKKGVDWLCGCSSYLCRGPDSGCSGRDF